MKPERKRPVCIYVDNSNIYISGQEIAASKGEDKHKFRIDFRNFLLLLTQGTLLFEEMTWGGSGSESALEVLEKLKQHGADVQFLPRSEHPEHETVDAFIQLTMYRQARKYRQQPGTMILCSGDGKGFAGESGFLYDLAGFKEDGWDIEVYSWTGPVTSS
jgi:hypothetical protein